MTGPTSAGTPNGLLHCIVPIHSERRLSRKLNGRNGPKGAGQFSSKRPFIKSFFLGCSRSLPHINQMLFDVLCGKEGCVDISLRQKCQAPLSQLLDLRQVLRV